MNYINYKRTVLKLSDDFEENNIFISADVSILGYVCGVSQYPQYYDLELDMHQVLSRPYWGYFEGCTGEKFIKEI